jgi:hypothetical protein
MTPGEAHGKTLRPARDWRIEFRLREEIPESEFRGGYWVEKESFETLRVRPKGFKKVTDPDVGLAVYAFDEEQDRLDEECMAEFSRFRQEQGFVTRNLDRLFALFSSRSRRR